MSSLINYQLTSHFPKEFQVSFPTLILLGRCQYSNCESAGAQIKNAAEEQKPKGAAANMLTCSQ